MLTMKSIALTLMLSAVCGCHKSKVSETRNEGSARSACQTVAHEFAGKFYEVLEGDNLDIRPPKKNYILLSQLREIQSVGIQEILVDAKAIKFIDGVGLGVDFAECDRIAISIEVNNRYRQIWSIWPTIAEGSQ